MELINSIPPVIVPNLTAACDGGDGPLGHPKIYIATGRSTLENPAVCGYCGLRFVNKNAVLADIESGKEVQQGKDYIFPSNVEDFLHAHDDHGH